jgi:hypothetical protein
MKIQASVLWADWKILVLIYCNVRCDEVGRILKTNTQTCQRMLEEELQR